MSKTEVSTEQKFKLWYSEIFCFMEHKSKDGNGAIVALAAALPLYERWLVSKSGESRDEKVSLLNEDLKIRNFSNADNFWNVFRDGLCHTGHFFKESDTQRRKIRRGEDWNNLPEVCFNIEFPDFPEFKEQDGKEYIILNPWGLIRHICSKFEGNYHLLEEGEAPLLPLFFVKS